MNAERVPETDEQVEDRLREAFGDLSTDGYAGALWGLYQVHRAQGNSVKRAWVMTLAAGAREETPDYYLEEVES